MDFMVQGLKSTAFNEEQEEAINQARKAAEIIGEEIRGANNSDNGSYPLALANDHEIIFYSDADDDDSMEKIRYYIYNGTIIMREKIVSGPSRDYLQTPSAREVARYLNNQSEPLFIYYGRNGLETDIINEIRMIGINIKINVTPWRSPNDYYVATDINLRNLKDNL